MGDIGDKEKKKKVEVKKIIKSRDREGDGRWGEERIANKKKIGSDLGGCSLTNELFRFTLWCEYAC